MRRLAQARRRFLPKIWPASARRLLLDLRDRVAIHDLSARHAL
jgi:hypothetical protein